ncbi:MAG: transporter substrate-binding domain-containing protein, partial [Bacteroidota bacterium]
IDDFKDETLGTIGNSATSQWLANNFYVKKKEYQNLEALLNALDKEKIDAIAYDRPILSNIIARDSLSRYKMIDTKYNPQFYAFGLNKALSETLKDSINFSMLNNIEKIDWKILLSENNLN